MEDRRKANFSEWEVRSLMLEHAEACPKTSSVRDLQKEVQELWKKIILIEVLDNRVKALEDSIATIEIGIAATMNDIHKIQTSLAESNVVHLWVGRIVIGATSAVVAFVSAKHS